MFRQLFDLRAQRSMLHAVLFYLVYFFIGLVISAALGAVAALATGTGPDNAFDLGLFVGQIFAVVYTGFLALAILRAKQMFGQILYLAVGIAGIAVAALGGLLFGLIFVAFLSTRPVNPMIDAMAHSVQGPAAY